MTSLGLVSFELPDGEERPRALEAGVHVRPGRGLHLRRPLDISQGERVPEVHALFFFDFFRPSSSAS